jgi:NAD(P)-dependent dehydrogenase (short-subunit alcohol dehydrogenase family)
VTSPASLQTAAVTGASRGIGRAIALELGRQGWRVFALARSETDLSDLAAKGAETGMAIEPLAMDIADDASRESAVSTILDRTGGYGVDLLVNNAGYGQLGPLEEIDVDKLRRQLDVNLVGLHALTIAFLPAMRERRHGRIVSIGSIAGRVAAPFMGAYNTSKFALEGWSDTLRNEVAPFGVRVILIEPGPIRTSFGEAADALREESESSPYWPLLRRWQRARGASSAFERSPEAVARVVARAVGARHPRPRYTVTVNARLGTVSRRVVPDIVTDWFFRRAMGGSRHTRRR